MNAGRIPFLWLPYLKGRMRGESNPDRIRIRVGVGVWWIPLHAVSFSFEKYSNYVKVLKLKTIIPHQVTISSSFCFQMRNILFFCFKWKVYVLATVCCKGSLLYYSAGKKQQQRIPFNRKHKLKNENEKASNVFIHSIVWMWKKRSLTWNYPQ